jgi:hypothetical protein
VEPRATDVYGRAPAVSLVAFDKVGDQAGEIRAASAPAR